MSHVWETLDLKLSTTSWGAAQQKFPLSFLLRLEERENGNDEAEVEVSVDPTSIYFPPNKTVTAWEAITSMFRDLHVTSGANVRWSAKQVLTRFRFRSNVKKDGTSKSILLLECIILESGTWEALAESKRKILSGNGSSAILLASLNVGWYSPLEQHRLPTVPGLLRKSAEVLLPPELKLRWMLQAALKRSDSGKSVESRQEYEAYMKMDLPYSAVTNNDTPFFLPYTFGVVDDLSGRGADIKSSFVRNGKVIHRARAPRSKVSPRSKPSRPNKFNTLPKGPTLASCSLPKDTPVRLKTLAGALFNASVASSTAGLYNSAAKHIKNLEAELGRSFSWPLSPADSNLVIIYLADRGLKGSTINSYLSGIRRLAMSKGVASPPAQSKIAKSILKGYQNLKRNPKKAAAEVNHRPLTIPFLRLLGHAINKYFKGVTFDKLCFWTVCVIAFWGAFRLGELLCEDTSSFSPHSDLLGSDALHMSDSSFALWIRDPKVASEMGDVVEIWSIPQFSDINPFPAFLSFWNLRLEKGFLPTHPLFLRAIHV